MRMEKIREGQDKLRQGDVKSDNICRIDPWETVPFWIDGILVIISETGCAPSLAAAIVSGGIAVPAAILACGSFLLDATEFLQDYAGLETPPTFKKIKGATGNASLANSCLTGGWKVCAKAIALKLVDEYSTEGDASANLFEECGDLCVYTGDPKNVFGVMTETCYWEKNHEALKSVQTYFVEDASIYEGKLFDRNGKKTFSAIWYHGFEQAYDVPMMASKFLNGLETESWSWYWEPGIPSEYHNLNSEHRITCWTNGAETSNCTGTVANEENCVVYGYSEALGHNVIDCLDFWVDDRCPSCPINPPEELNQLSKEADKSLWENWN